MIPLSVLLFAAAAAGGKVRLGSRCVLLLAICEVALLAAAAAARKFGTLALIALPFAPWRHGDRSGRCFVHGKSPEGFLS